MKDETIKVRRVQLDSEDDDAVVTYVPSGRPEYILQVWESPFEIVTNLIPLNPEQHLPKENE